MTEMKLFYEIGNNDKVYLALQVTRGFRFGRKNKYELSQWETDEVNVRKLLGINFNKHKDRLIFLKDSERIHFHIYEGNFNDLSKILQYCSKEKISNFDISPQNEEGLQELPFIRKNISSLCKV
jgi:hypothetical protein